MKSVLALLDEQLLDVKEAVGRVRLHLAPVVDSIGSLGVVLVMRESSTLLSL
jgi:hypothetical protein